MVMPMPNYLGIGLAAAQACEMRLGPICSERLGRYITTQIEQEREACARLMEGLRAAYLGPDDHRLHDAAEAIRERGKNAATGEDL